MALCEQKCGGGTALGTLGEGVGAPRVSLPAVRMLYLKAHGGKGMQVSSGQPRLLWRARDKCVFPERGGRAWPVT